MDTNICARIVFWCVRGLAHSKNKKVINLDKKIAYTNMDVKILTHIKQRVKNLLRFTNHLIFEANVTK